MGGRKEYQQKTKLQELYFDKDMSQKEIAFEYGVTPQTISWWFQKHDMPQYKK